MAADLSPRNFTAKNAAEISGAGQRDYPCTPGPLNHRSRPLPPNSIEIPKHAETAYVAPRKRQHCQFVLTRVVTSFVFVYHISFAACTYTALLNLVRQQGTSLPSHLNEFCHVFINVPELFYGECNGKCCACASANSKYQAKFFGRQ